VPYTGGQSGVRGFQNARDGLEVYIGDVAKEVPGGQKKKPLVAS